MKTFTIKSFHSVSLDSYNEGELRHVNAYDVSGTVKAENKIEAVDKYLNEVLGYNLGFENCDIIEDGLQTSCLVDGENLQPTKKQIELWERDEINLYSNNIDLQVYELTEVFF